MNLCIAEQIDENYSTDWQPHTSSDPNLQSLGQMPPLPPVLLLPQLCTLAAEDIGKLAHSVQQLTVGDLRGIPRFIPFPGKAR